MIEEKTIDNGLLIRTLKILGTTLLIGSWVITSLGYFPINLIIEVIGCAMWSYVAIVWKDWPLLGVNGAIGVLAFISMFMY